MLMSAGNVLRTFCSLLLCISLFACSQTKGTGVLTYEKAKKDVLARGPLVDPPVEKKYKFIQGGHKAAVPNKTVIEVWDPAKPTVKIKVEWAAAVVDEKKIAEMHAIKIQRNQLLKKLQAVILEKETQKLIYLSSLKAAAKAAERTWWEKYRGVMGLAVGGVIVGGLIVGLVYALTRGNGLTVNTNAYVLPVRR